MRAIVAVAVTFAIWSVWLGFHGFAGFQYIILIGLVVGGGAYILSSMLGGGFVWSVSPLWSEREVRYYDALRTRPRLDDDAFFDRFYSATDTPKDIPVRLRRLYRDIIGGDLSAMQPQDNIALIFDCLDFADVLYRVEREFKTKIPLSVLSQPPDYRDWPFVGGEIDGTFDSVVRYLARHRRIDLSHGLVASYASNSNRPKREGYRHAGTS